MELNKVYSVRQMAKILGIGADMLYKLIKETDFPYVKFYEAGEIRICGWQVKEWMDKNRRNFPVKKEA